MTFLCGVFDMSAQPNLPGLSQAIAKFNIVQTKADTVFVGWLPSPAPCPDRHIFAQWPSPRAHNLQDIPRLHSFHANRKKFPPCPSSLCLHHEV
mmetsp:Transcript_1100/g.2761  ORF Transcript_1100/g.2761 Transcript_1100/m.2761 type:complete len:94 (+) Transcript_1100:1650-1931(+)